MVLKLKQLQNKNVNFLFFYIKIKYDSFDGYSSFFSRFFRKNTLAEFYFLEFCFFFEKRVDDFYYLKIIFFYYNILDVSNHYQTLISDFIDQELRGQKIFKVKKVSTLTAEHLTHILKTEVSSYTLSIFYLTKNFQNEYAILMSLFEVEEKKDVVLVDNTRSYLLPLENDFRSTFYGSGSLKDRKNNLTGSLIYLIKVYLLRNESFNLKTILYFYKREEANNSDLNPQNYFYEYLKNNFEEVLESVYNFYLSEFYLSGQMFSHFLYIFINKDKEKILMYFKLISPFQKMA